MLIALDGLAIPYLHGRYDAMQGEPLFEDADPEYARGWCAFHKVENPYKTSVSRQDADEPNSSEKQNSSL